MEQLNPLMDHLVGPNQTTFIYNRQILNSFLVAHECIESRIRQGIPHLVWKLDHKKAYDSVNWHCLNESLECMDFGAKLREWVGYCVSSARFSILVNSCPNGFFGCGCGLRQNNPLSPLLLFSG